jgi:hypothetical protein
MLMCSCGEYCSVFSDPLCLKLTSVCVGVLRSLFHTKVNIVNIFQTNSFIGFFDNNKTDFISYNLFYEIQEFYFSLKLKI